MKHSHRQSGVVLILALVFLLILSVAGVSAMRLSHVEERMSGAFSDRNIAFQAAEAALLEAEDWLRMRNFQNENFYASCNQSECFNADCEQGLCFTGTFDQDDDCVLAVAETAGSYVYQTAEIWQDETRHRTAQLDVDGSGPIPAAKILIEFLCFTVRSPELAYSNAELKENQYSAVYFEPLYRISALAGGRKPSTRVMLQSTFRRD